jgi:Secretion system C-terminal sorting domain
MQIMKRLLKSLLWTSVFLLSLNKISAQVSLVQDGSFEDTTFNSFLHTGDSALLDWFTYAPYKGINEWILMGKNRAFQLNLPNTGYVRQEPRSGINAMGMINFTDSQALIFQVAFAAQSVARNKLKSKLIQGKQYCAKLYVTAEERQGFYFTNGLGMYFDNGQLDTLVTKYKDSSGNYTIALPQVPCNFIIDDTVNWMKLEGSFIANGTEEYLTIANFVPDSSLLKVVCGGGIPIPNFGELQNILIDDVSLIPLDITNWLSDLYISNTATSTWVGLDWRDYQDGRWYDMQGNLITTGPGFVLSPIEGNPQFIHEIELCGIIKRDTMRVIKAPTRISNAPIKSFNFSLVPNPTQGFFTVQLANSSNAISVIYMVDITGKQILMQTFQGQFFKYTSTLSKGIYFVKIENEGREVVQKLVVD